MIFVKDAKTLRFVTFNKAGEELLGISRQEMIGKTDYDFFPKEQADQFTKRDREVLSSRVSVEIQEELISTKAGVRLLSTRKIPLLDENGEPEYLLGISEDITEKKLAEVERYKLAQAQAAHAFFMNTPAVALMFKGPHHLIEQMNPTFYRLIGERNIIGRTVADAFSEVQSQSIVKQMDNVYCTGTPFVATEFPIPYLRDGKLKQGYFNVVIDAMKDSDGMIYGLMAHAIDVTEQVMARRKVESLVDELKTAVAARDEFLSIASHELKTPITSLKLQVQMFERFAKEEEASAPGPTIDRIRKTISSTSRQITRLTALVEELLDVSRIRSGKFTLTFEEVDLVGIVGDIVDRFAEQLRLHGCQLEVHAPRTMTAYCDRFRIEQSIVNLISNAMKYGCGKPIIVTVEGDDAAVRITVQDHGNGIHKEHQARIFERFERLTSAREFSGLGLGLFIAQQNVRAHGGEIRVRSDLGKGSLFTIEIPRRTRTNPL